MEKKNKLTISSGVISCDNGFEMNFEEFIKELTENINKDEEGYDIFYNEESGDFSIYFCWINYELPKLDEEYSDISSRLRNLCDISSKDEDEEESKILTISLGVVSCEDGFEMIFDKFINKLTKKINKRNYGVFYQEEDDSFEILFNGTYYNLPKLDKEYSYAYRILRDLSDITDEIIKKEEEIKLEEERKREEEEKKRKEREKLEEYKRLVIANAEKENNFDNYDDETKKIYLDYLKNKLSYFKNVIPKSFKDEKEYIDSLYDGVFFIWLFVSTIPVIMVLYMY